MSRMQIILAQGPPWSSYFSQCSVWRTKTRMVILESKSVIPGKWNTMHIDYSHYKIEVDGEFGMVITTIGIKIITWIDIWTWIKVFHHLQKSFNGCLFSQKCILYALCRIIFYMNVDEESRYILFISMVLICTLLLIPNSRIFYLF